MSEKARFLMLIGVAGAGKSSMAEQLMEDRNDIVLISSDSIRKELNGSEESQDNTNQVFELMLSRTKEFLKEGTHVIYDATNVSRKRRKHLIKQLPKDVEKIACYISTDYKMIISQNAERERKVPEHVINNMYKTMQLPIYSEGWDKIVYFHHDDIVEQQLPKQFTDAVRIAVAKNTDGYNIMAFLAEYFEEFFGVYELAQDSKYHTFSVSRHIYYVYEYIMNNISDDDKDKEMMLWTALLHDVGKHFCKSFKNRKGEDTRYANFIGHENVGSQMAMTFLHKMGFSDEFAYNVSTLIQFHMHLLKQDVNKQKLLNDVGEDMYNKLEILRNADTLSH